MLDIVIPTIDHPSLIKRAISSIVKYCSNLNKINLYIVNDASDYPNEEYEKVLTQFPMLRSQLVRNKARLGPGPSRNIGIKQGNSDWITFLDGDDTYKEDIFRYIPSDDEKDLIITTVQSWHGYIY